MPAWMTAEELAKPRPLGSITASAARLTSRNGDDKSTASRRTTRPGPMPWQEEGWELHDLVGEFYFLVNTLANRIAKGALYVGEVEPDKPTAEPVNSEDEQAQAILSKLGVNQAGRAQLIRRMAVNLIVAGEVWLFGMDEDLINAALDAVPEGITGTQPVRVAGPDTPTEDLPSYAWRALSVSEIAPVKAAGGSSSELEITLEDESKIVVSSEDATLIRVWRPHDRRAWEATSATKAALPVLRELVGLTMHVAAQVDSRLAGAGILAIKESVQRAIRAAEGLAPSSPEDPVTTSLTQYMMEPIGNRESAAAVVPIVLTYPDDVENPITHISFASPLDAEARELREEAVRRFALGMDAPPEILLGTAAANHWGAWLVAEDTVTMHVEPPLALICDALTTQYLWPALIAAGRTEDEARRFVVWYSVDHMVVRPNLFEETKYAYEAKEIDGDTLRENLGFDISDAPEEGQRTAPTREENRDEAVRQALALLTGAPLLASSPGLPSLVAQIEAVLNNEEEQLPVPPTEVEAPPAEPAGEPQPAGVLPTGPTTDGPGGPE